MSQCSAVLTFVAPVTPAVSSSSYHLNSSQKTSPESPTPESFKSSITICKHDSSCSTNTDTTTTNNNKSANRETTIVPIGSSSSSKITAKHNTKRTKTGKLSQQPIVTLSSNCNSSSSRILLRKQLQIYSDWANHYLQKRYQELDINFIDDDDDDEGDNGEEQDCFNGRDRDGIAAIYENQQSIQNKCRASIKRQNSLRTSSSNLIGNNRRLISNLANDIQDGVLLISIVESVTDCTLQNVSTTPKTSKEMIGNIECCIKFLDQLGVNVKGIQPKDINEGNLKSILTLFFNISRYKQSLKQQCNGSSGTKQSPTSPNSQFCPNGPSPSVQSPSDLVSPFSSNSSLSGSSPLNHNSTNLNSNLTMPSTTLGTSAPSAAMISRLPFNSSNPHSIKSSSKLPGSSLTSSGIPSSGLSSISSTVGTNRKIVTNSKSSVPPSRSSSPLSSGGQSTQPSSSGPVQNSSISAISRIKSSSTNRTPRPSSTSSIPQIGGAGSQLLSNSSIVAPSVNTATATAKQSVPRAKIVASSSTGQRSASNSKLSDASISSGSTNSSNPAAAAASKKSSPAATAAAAASIGSKVQQTQPVKYRLGGSESNSSGHSSKSTSSFMVSSLSKLQQAGTTTSSNTLTSRHSNLAHKKSSLPPPTTRSRPISTIIESTTSTSSASSSAIPSMNMASTATGSYPSSVPTSVLPTSSIGKPTATVKAMVTPTVTPSVDSQNEQLVKIGAKTGNDNNNKSVINNNNNSASAQQTKDTIAENDMNSKLSCHRNLSSQQSSNNENDDDDSGSSNSTSSDIESALASIEPMQPISERSLQVSYALKGTSGQTNNDHLNGHHNGIVYNGDSGSIYGNALYQSNRESGNIYGTATTATSATTNSNLGSRTNNNNNNNNKSSHPSNRGYTSGDYSDNSESGNFGSSTQVKSRFPGQMPADTISGNSSNNRNHLSDSNTLLNLSTGARTGVRSNRSGAKSSEFTLGPASMFAVGLDETSSLSSDPGMISGTDVSATTTSSSMCSNSTAGDRRNHHHQLYSLNSTKATSQNRRSSTGGSTKSLSTTKMNGTTMMVHRASIDTSSSAIGESTKRSSATSNKSLSSSSKNSSTTAYGNPGSGSNGDLSKRPLSSPSSAKLIQSGTLPLAGSTIGSRNGLRGVPHKQYYHTTAGSGGNKAGKLRSGSVHHFGPGAHLNSNGDQVYSDSECVQQRSFMSNSMYRQMTPGSLASANVTVRQMPSQQQQQQQSQYQFKSSDGDTEHANNTIYSNMEHVYGKLPAAVLQQTHPSQNPYLHRNAFTDTESLESLNLACSLASNSSTMLTSGDGHLQHQHLQQQAPPPPPQSQQQQPPHPYYTHLTKPGDLICEYETVNRMRETMSASPNRWHQDPAMMSQSPFNRGSSVDNRPPIPAHLNGRHKLPGTDVVHESGINSINNQSNGGGSSLSLLSSTSSMFATPEEKYINEIRKLRRELDQLNEKNFTLSSQLTANAHMVAAFEQSLSSMTSRLQQLSSSSELKDCELERLRQTIESFKRQTTMVSSSKSSNHRSLSLTPNIKISSKKKGNQTSESDHDESTTSKFQRNLSTESVDSFASCGDILSSGKGKSKKSKIKLNGGQTNSGSGSSDGGRQTSWIRSSFSRAFKKNKSASGSSSVTGSPIKSNTIGGAGSAANREMSDAESNSLAETGCDASNSRSVPSSPLMSIRSFRSSNSTDSSSKGEPESIEELRIQLRQKEMQLTDMRLESLTSAHQLENLKEMVNQMRIELSSLRQDNDRLQRLANTKSLASSQSSMISAIGSHGSSTVPSLTAANNPNNHGKHQNNQLMEESNSLESIEMDVSISNSDCSSLKMVTLGSGSHTLASLVISPKTNWEQMDSIVRKHFKDHLIRVDLNLSLGITADSLACYLVGDENIRRNLSDVDAMADNQTPELLPFGYLVSQSHINLQFKSALDSLAFDTLTPKSVLDHFIRLLNESRRLILSGSSGTGKTYLAHKLAEYFAVKDMTSSSSTISTHQQPPITNNTNNNNDNNNIVENSLPMSGMMIRPGAIATFNVDHKNAKELRAYLSNIAEQCESNISLGSTQSLQQQRHLPTVIILDNLHHIDSLMEIFNDLHKIHQPNCPYIIGTINQTITKHNIGSFEQYNFRWAILSNTTEPVSGFLGRFLRRKFLETEAKHNSLSNNTKLQNCEMGKIVEWIPKVCRFLNKYLGNYFPNDTVSIGPRLFTSCPIDVNGSQIWFTDLWNFSILPFLLENLREYWNKQNKEQRRMPEVSIVDPTEWIVENYPWQSSLEWSDHLNRLRIEDIVCGVSGDCTGAGGLSLDSSVKQQSNTLNNNSTNHTDPTQQTAAEHHGSNQDIDINKVNDPFLQMLLKLKEASEYSSQPDGNNNNNNNNCNNK